MWSHRGTEITEARRLEVWKGSQVLREYRGFSQKWEECESWELWEACAIANKYRGVDSFLESKNNFI